MKRWIVFPGMLLAGFLVSGSPAAAGPRAQFDKEIHDFGKVRSGSTVTEEFTLTNQGDAPLIIKELRSSCGCTKAIHGSREVPPQGQTKIVATFDTTGMRAGRKGRAVFVDSNDPQRPTVTLTLTADIVRDLVVEPPSVAKELTAYTESVTFPLRVTNTSTTPYAITGVKTTAHGVKPLLVPDTVTLAPGKTTEITLELKLDRDPPRFFYSGSISLITSHSAESELHVRYLVSLRSGR